MALQITSSNPHIEARWKAEYHRLERTKQRRAMRKAWNETGETITKAFKAFGNLLPVVEQTGRAMDELVRKALPVCPGCRRTFNNMQGLRAHRSHRNAAAGCRTKEYQG